MPEEIQAPVLTAHETAMIAKVDANQAALGQPVVPPVVAPVATPATRPEHIPEKFWDAATGVAKVDEMAKSYAELEKARAPAAPLDAAAQAAADAAKAAAPPATDFAVYSTEFATNGKLADTSYEALAKAGIPKAIVDEFIASKAQGARVAEYESKEAVAEAHSHAGGKEAFDGMLTWAAANLPAAEQAAFDDAVTGSPAARSLAVKSLRAQYEAAAGKDPSLISGEGSGSGGVAFQSRAEVTAAMRDPRYKSDPAYRAQVTARIDGMPTF